MAQEGGRDIALLAERGDDDERDPLAKAEQRAELNPWSTVYS